jgi:hypothetical protein
LPELSHQPRRSCLFHKSIAGKWLDKEQRNLRFNPEVTAGACIIHL